jgi:hypothetical protein
LASLGALGRLRQVQRVGGDGVYNAAVSD